MPKRMNAPLARRGRDGLAQIGFDRFDVLGVRFENDPGGNDGGTPPAQENNNPPAGGDDLGFPANTPLDDMTPDQKAAYWRNQSKVQQKEADAFKKLGLTPEQIKKLVDDTEAARVASLDEQQKAVEAARKEGEDKALAEAREKFAKPAVQAILVARTKQADESDEDATTRVAGLLDVLDVQKFIGDDGTIDAAKVETFAQSLAPKDGNGGNPGGDPLAGLLGRQSRTPEGHGGSVAAMEAAIYDRLKPSK